MAKRSKKEGEEGEDEVEEEGEDGETPYWRKWITPARCWAHGRNAVRKATARLFRRVARGIQSFLEYATYPRKCHVSRIPQL